MPISPPKRCAAVLLRALRPLGLAAVRVGELNAHGTEVQRAVALQRYLPHVRVDAAGNRYLETLKRPSITAPLASAGMEGLRVAGLVASGCAPMRLRYLRTQRTSG